MPRELDAAVEAARELGGESPPPWLARCFRWILPTLTQLQNSAPMVIRRAEARKKLLKAEEQARGLASVFRSDLVDFIQHGADNILEAEADAIAIMFDDIALRAKTAADHIPQRGGRTRARPLRNMTDRGPPITAQLLLALTVAEAWTALRGANLGARNTKAHAAADAMWREVDNTMPEWEPHFEEAQTVIAAPGIGLRESWRWRVQGEIEAVKNMKG